MATSLRSITFCLVLVLVLSSTILSVIEARPLHDLSPPDNNVIKDVINGMSTRTLSGSGSGPSPGVGHRRKMLQHAEVFEVRGPSPRIGQRPKSLENNGVLNHSGPSPGGGHRDKRLLNIAAIKHSGPSPGQGHKYITGRQS